jgi:hypothetical protein
MRVLIIILAIALAAAALAAGWFGLVGWIAAPMPFPWTPETVHRAARAIDEAPSPSPNEPGMIRVQNMAAAGDTCEPWRADDPAYATGLVGVLHVRAYYSGVLKQEMVGNGPWAGGWEFTNVNWTIRGNLATGDIDVIFNDGVVSAQWSAENQPAPTGECTTNLASPPPVAAPPGTGPNWSRVEIQDHPF